MVEILKPSKKRISTGGSVVECSPATRAARVRFPASAFLIDFKGFNENIFENILEFLY